MPVLCPQCAIEIPDGAVSCSACGTVTGVPLTDPPSTTVETPPTVNAPMFSYHDELSGIGGWLILVAIGLGVSPFLISASVLRDARIMLGANYQTYLAAHRSLALLILFEAATNFILMTSMIALNILFYKKKRSFPGWMITFFVGQIIFMAIDHFSALQFNPKSSPTTLARSVIGGAIWIPYYLVSKRVKATFVN